MAPERLDLIEDHGPTHGGEEIGPSPKLVIVEEEDVRESAREFEAFEDPLGRVLHSFGRNTLRRAMDAEVRKEAVDLALPLALKVSVANDRGRERSILRGQGERGDGLPESDRVRDEEPAE